MYLSPFLLRAILEKSDVIIPKRIKNVMSPKMFALMLGMQCIVVLMMTSIFIRDYRNPSPFKATTAALIQQATKPGGAIPPSIATGELTRRLQRKELTASEAQKLITHALTIQADPTKPWDRELGEWIEIGRSQGLVTDPQWQKQKRETEKGISTFNLVAAGGKLQNNMYLSPFLSRGGYIVMQLADQLKTDGCECNGKTTKNIPVRFLGLYDPVDNAPGYGTTDVVSSNVEYAYVAIAKGVSRDKGKGRTHIVVDLSRKMFNRKGHSAEDPAKTNYNSEYYIATHGAIGGAPWDGDRPKGHTEANDIKQAIAVDRDMRDHAQKAGVTINDISNYGYIASEGKND